MKITKSQLKRIIEEAIDSNSAAFERYDADSTLVVPTSKLVEQFKNSRLQQFKKDPSAFDGYSTEKEWVWQVEEATAMLEEEIDRSIKKVKSMLYDGRWHPRG